MTLSTPSTAMRASVSCRAPSLIETMAITEATPRMMPSVASAERNLCSARSSRAIRQADALGQLFGAFSADVDVHAGINHRHLDVADDVELRKKIEALEDEADLRVAMAGKLVIVQLGHVFAAEVIVAGIDDVEQA